MPSATEDGLPRPGCLDQSDCWDWAGEQCKQSKDSELLIKTYCYDEYCYVLCPPALPTTAPTAFGAVEPSSAVTEYFKYREPSPSTTVNHSEKTKRNPGISGPSGGGRDDDPIEEFPTISPPNDASAPSTTTAGESITSRCTSETTPVTETSIYTTSEGYLEAGGKWKPGRRPPKGKPPVETMPTFITSKTRKPKQTKSGTTDGTPNSAQTSATEITTLY